MTTTAPVRSHRTRDTALLVVATLVAWWAWTAWDLRYDADPVAGSASGPWSAWQVAGSVLTLLVVVMVGVRRLGVAPVLVVVPLAYTAAWVATALVNADSGLFVIGAAMVLAGTTAGVGVVAPLVHLLARRTVPDRR